MKASFVIITGFSGSGKTTALHALEDSGFLCIDNLPPALVEPFLDSIEQSESERKIALVLDVRTPTLREKGPDFVRAIESRGHSVDVLYLDAQYDVLIRRFSQTRRSHPLAKGGGVHEAIDKEERHLSSLKKIAQHHLDTSFKRPRDLGLQVVSMFASGLVTVKPRLQLLSFGFKNGIPTDTDMILDVRFLLNPYFDADIYQLTGEDTLVHDYIFGNPEGAQYFQKTKTYIEFLLPLFQKEGKHYLTIAIGCTGGQHRSVAIVSRLTKELSSQEWTITKHHRDLHRETS